MRKRLIPCRMLIFSSLGATLLMSIAAPCLADGSLADGGLTNTSANGVVTARQMDLLNSRIAVLEAKLKIAKLHADIKNAGKTDNHAKPSLYGQPMPMGGDFGIPAAQNMPGKTASASPQKVPLPQVESISGVGRRLSAEVALSNGGQRIIAVGDHLHGGLVVQSITANGVMVSDKHGVRSLPFANGSAPAASSSGGMSGPSAPTSFAAPVMPPAPMMPGMGAPGMGAPMAPRG